MLFWKPDVKKKKEKKKKENLSKNKKIENSFFFACFVRLVNHRQ